MYSLLVSSSPWSDHHDTMPSDRILTYTDPGVAVFYRSSIGPDFNKLGALPALFIPEYEPETGQVARVGIIHSAKPTAREILIDYHFDPAIPPIPMELVAANARRLGIEMPRKGWTELSTTHWAVKDADLFKILAGLIAKSTRQPSAFQLSQLATTEADLVSVMMPFEGFGAVYDAIQKTAIASGMRCLRADDIWENQAIIQDIVSLIDRSSIVICDCTDRNPNVFYEIGIAHSLGKQVILITQKPDDVPFDLRHLRYIRYFKNDLSQLMKDLTVRIDKLQES